VRNRIGGIESDSPGLDDELLDPLKLRRAHDQKLYAEFSATRPSDNGLLYPDRPLMPIRLKQRHLHTETRLYFIIRLGHAAGAGEIEHLGFAVRLIFSDECQTAIGGHPSRFSQYFRVFHGDSRFIALAILTHGWRTETGVAGARRHSRRTRIPRQKTDHAPTAPMPNRYWSDRVLPAAEQ